MMSHQRPFAAHPATILGQLPESIQSEIEETSSSDTNDMTGIPPWGADGNPKDGILLPSSLDSTPSPPDMDEEVEVMLPRLRPKMSFLDHVLRKVADIFNKILRAESDGHMTPSLQDSTRSLLDKVERGMVMLSIIISDMEQTHNHQKQDGNER